MIYSDESHSALRHVEKDRLQVSDTHVAESSVVVVIFSLENANIMYDVPVVVRRSKQRSIWKI